ncbi:hypothetical protein [Halorubrum laminariae]|uniref:DUF8163 domain-containing protein n=1 Tax=Halorubrum laminariae TaxID=1433523 RepID=A0ABD6C0L7_9EURY|nr:hypothetical protein [Halorubrum laminariae]
MSLLAVCVVGAVAGTVDTLVVTLPLLVVAFVVPAPLAFVAGHLALIPTIGTADTLLFGVVQIALLILLTEPARQHHVTSAMATTGVAYLALGGGIVLWFQRDLWVTGVLLCLIVAGGTYLMRRITLVRLGLVDPVTTRNADSTATQDTEAKE